MCKDDLLKRCWAEVDLDALAHNYHAIRDRVGQQVKVMGIVKADAYGHGDACIAAELQRLGADYLGVSNVEEALSLRRQGIHLPILILGPTPTEFAPALVQHAITQTVHSLSYGRELAAAAAAAGGQALVHIKLDTGMSRIGFQCDDGQIGRSVREVALLAKEPALRLEGIFTHFASADEPTTDGHAYTELQLGRFLQAVVQLEAQGVHFALRHCANSAGVLVWPQAHLDMVRPGIILYGIDPDASLAGVLDLQPVMGLKTVVTQLKQVPAGTQVSYGRIFTAGHEMQVATVPVGYADGFPRLLSGKMQLLVRGQRAPMIGRVCMDQQMLDVTGIPGVQVGDEVVIFGRQGAEVQTAAQLAGAIGTIAYELISVISKRVPRVYLRAGQPVGYVDYISQKFYK